MRTDSPPENLSLPMRVWRSFRRDPLWPTDDRSRMRLALNDLILHLHPTKTPTRGLRFTYTFGLGGLSILLFLLQAITGIMLTFAYTPSPEAAYNSIMALQTDVWFGQFLRNMHHWSGNLLIVVVVLHLLRVFYTGALNHPRQFNWILGLLLLGLVALANFTGYLLPWDQLSFWAVTVATSIISYIPLIGEWLSGLLLGGSEVGANTLRNFYSLHVVVVPFLMAVIISFHIFRVRVDKFSVPRRLDESEPPRPLKMSTTVPHLISREFIFGLVVMALLVTWAVAMDAPLLAAANPIHPPNPTKAAWYFMGIQELLLHFHPTFAGVIMPGLGILGLVALPYLNRDMDSEGIWFRSRRGRWLAVFNLLLGTALTAGFILLDEYWLDLPGMLPGVSTVISNGILPLALYLLFLFGYSRLLRAQGATACETRLALFNLLLASFLTLTVIGIFFRGENWVLQFPWEV